MAANEDFTNILDAGSQLHFLVQEAKIKLLETLDLATLVSDLGKLGNFIRVAYNGVAGNTSNTELQIKVQRLGYKIAKLADRSAVTVHNFKGASKDVLEKLQGTYQYLLDGLEEMALETLSLLSNVAEQVAKAAEELHGEFEAATTDVIEALEDTYPAKGVQEDKRREKIKKREELERQRNSIGDQTVITREALRQCIELTEQIRNCKDDESLAAVAIEALCNSFDALKSLSAIMMSAALFWRQMQKHCEALAKDMQLQVEKAMKYPEDKRLKFWTSKASKTHVIRYYSKWVALDDLCGSYMEQIKKTRGLLYGYLKENPTPEQSRDNVRRLAATFKKDLEKAQREIADIESEASKEMAELRG